MKFQRIVFGLFGTFMILFSRCHCYVCDNGQMITTVSHEECFNELSSVVELVCGVMSGVKKRAVSGKMLLFLYTIERILKLSRILFKYLKWFLFHFNLNILMFNVDEANDN